MKTQSKWKQLLWLYLQFLRIGLFTFGGGWSIIAQMQRDFVEKRKLLTDEELVDMTGLARSLPGVMVANVTYMFGHRTAGIAGGIVAVLGLNTAPFLVMILITSLYERFHELTWMNKALNGVRAAVLPIIASAALKLAKSSLKDLGTWVIMLAAFALCTFTGLFRVLIVVMGAAVGLIVMGVRQHNDLS